MNHPTHAQKLLQQARHLKKAIEATQYTDFDDLWQDMREPMVQQTVASFGFLPQEQAENIAYTTVFLVHQGLKVAWENAEKPDEVVLKLLDEHTQRMKNEMPADELEQFQHAERMAVVYAASSLYHTPVWQQNQAKESLLATAWEHLEKEADAQGWSEEDKQALKHEQAQLIDLASQTQDPKILQTMHDRCAPLFQQLNRKSKCGVYPG